MNTQNLQYANGLHQVANAQTQPFMSPLMRNGIITPGLPILPPGVERYVVKGGGSVTVKVDQGDKITVVDKEGLQAIELLLFDKDGLCKAAYLGKPKGQPASGLMSLLQIASVSTNRLSKTIKNQGWDIASAEAIVVANQQSRPGEQQHFTVQTTGSLIVAAPGLPMQVDAQNPVSEIILFIERVNPIKKRIVSPAEPLAEPLLDANIQPGNAYAYLVKKGQYIQVMDVQGRECSDFQAFDLRALDKKRFEDIDPTTTRALMGRLYPTPGLYGKYYSIAQQPLLEIVHDTVGRHDTFGLACTAKYYDDLGYPGHVNCSDNLNIAAAEYGIPERAGWPAINFFFNTMNDSSNAIFMDDPYSRPGDYVLMRAFTDLVCFSTACPCDVDEANAWNPTDIQVRVYDEKEFFKKSLGFRMTTESDLQMTKETAFHDCFAEHTRNFVEYNGYWLPSSFPKVGVIDEYWACRKNVVVMDLSPLRKYEILGPDAKALMQQCVPRDIEKLAIGQVVYTAICNEHGGMIDDGTIFRLGENNFRWVGGCGTSGLWLREQAHKLNLNVWVKSSTDELHNLAVQGPNSRELLKNIIWTHESQPTVEELGWFRFSVARMHQHDGAPIIISRTGYTGELGYEIFTHPKHAKAVFDAVWQAGQAFDIKPLGLEALDLVRIEAGLIFAGYEFCDQTDPFEAGIGFSVPLKSKTADFIGKEALIKRKANPQRKLVGLELAGNLPAKSGDLVYMGRKQVGQITSAMRSPILEKNIALCRMLVEYSELDTEVEVGQLDGMQKRLTAKVVPFPFYDPTKSRVRA